MDPMSTELNLSRHDLRTESSLDLNLQYSLTLDVTDWFCWYLADEAADGKYTIEEASSKLLENHWRGSFKGGVSLNKKIVEDHLHAFDKTTAEYREYSSRYDLTFVQPNGRQIFLRVGSQNTNFAIPP